MGLKPDGGPRRTDIAATLPAGDDRELLRRYHEQGDLAAREQLVERHLPLVRALAHRYTGRGEPIDDLEQVGAIGLIKAIDRYDLEREVALSTYATPTVVGEIKRHFRDRGWAIRIPRGLQELSARAARAVERLGASLGRSPSLAELAAELDTTPEAVLEAMEASAAYSPISLSAGVAGDREADPLETIGTADAEFEHLEQRMALAPALGSLPEREQQILQMRFVDGLTQTQIAERVGISQMHVSRLIRKSLAAMRQEIADT
jgi:RNA polymerase sigma-B factor